MKHPAYITQGSRCDSENLNLLRRRVIRNLFTPAHLDLFERTYIFENNKWYLTEKNVVYKKVCLSDDGIPFQRRYIPFRRIKITVEKMEKMRRWCFAWWVHIGTCCQMKIIRLVNFWSYFYSIIIFLQGIAL